MKNEFINPLIDIISLNNEDIVTTSGNLKEVNFNDFVEE